MCMRRTQVSNDESNDARPNFQGSYRTLCRRVKEEKLSKQKERFFEQTHPPGKQAQFDFKEKIKIPFARGTQIVHLHFGTLPCSGHFNRTQNCLKHSNSEESE